MRVSPILSALRIEPPSSCPTSGKPSFQSTLQELKKMEKPSVFQRALTFLRTKCIGFLQWLLACFSTEKEDGGEEDNFYKDVEPSNKGIKYSLIDDGETTDNEILFGLKYAQLEGISFPDEDKSARIPEMLLHIIEREKIDCIRTSNFAKAKMLWDCGLQTESLINFTLEKESRLNAQIKAVLKLALERKDVLDQSAKDALDQILEGMIESIITGATDLNQARPDSSSYQSVDDFPEEALKKSFKPSLAKSSMKKLEEKLGHQVDVKKLNIWKNPYYQVALKMMEQAHEGNSSMEEFALSLSDLFTLMDATKIPASKDIIQNLSGIIFVKRNQL